MEDSLIYVLVMDAVGGVYSSKAMDIKPHEQDFGIQVDNVRPPCYFLWRGNRWIPVTNDYDIVLRTFYLCKNATERTLDKFFR